MSSREQTSILGQARQFAACLPAPVRSADFKTKSEAWLRRCNEKQLDLFVEEMSKVDLPTIKAWVSGLDGADPVRAHLTGKLVGVDAGACDLRLSRHLDRIAACLREIPGGPKEFLPTVEACATAGPVAMAYFPKSSKRNIYEPLATACIEVETGFRACQAQAKPFSSCEIRFSKSGKPCIGRKTKQTCKSVDILVPVEMEDGSFHVYLVSHKFARQGGGHQDNQSRDALQFLEFAGAGHRKNLPIPGLAEVLQDGLDLDETPAVTWEPALVLDGQHFSSQIKKLTAAARKPNFFIGTTDMFCSFLTSKHPASEKVS